MKNFYIFLSLFFALTNSGQAILIGDEETLKGSHEIKNTSGAYESVLSYYDLNLNRVDAEGNATLVKLGENKILGLSAAHCLKTQSVEIIKGVIVSRQKKSPNQYDSMVLNLPFIQVDDKFFNKEFEAKRYIYDCAFSSCLDSETQKNLNPRLENGLFEGGFFEQPLQHGQEYDVKIRSFGPSFDNQLTFYRNHNYHEANTKITYDKEGYFFKITKSRDFYFTFSPKSNGSYEWSCDLLPSPGDITTIKGDSGSLITTQDGQAIALVAASNYDDFYQNNQQVSLKLLNFKKNQDGKIFTQETIENLVKFIETEVAVPEKTKKLVTETQQHIYRFTLREKFASPVSKNCFTPLQPYISLIKASV